MKYLSCGEYNKNYKYILLTVIFSYISTVLFGTGYYYYTKDIYFGKIYPDKIQKTQETLSHHIIIHNIYRNIGILIISIILIKYEQKSISSNNKNNIKTVNNNELKLIYNSDFQQNESNLFIYIILFLYNIQDILIILFFQFDLKEFNIWQFQIPLLSYFNYRLLNIKIYDHHKFALYLSSIIPLCEKIVHLFIHLFSEDDKNLIYHRYKYLSFIGIILYLIIIIIKSYSLTKIKIFMDFYYISPTLLLIVIGIVGIVVNFIIMIIFTFIKCGTINDIDIHLCPVDENNNRNETYLENFIIYFKALNNANYYDIIIELFTNLIGTLAHFCYIYFYILIIKYFSTMHIIIYFLLYSFCVHMTFIITSIINNSYFNKDFNPWLSIFSLVSDICSGVGILIYCEIIELNFCNLNYFLRRNIIIRSEEELNKNNTDKLDNLFEDEKDSESGGNIN